MKHLIKNGTIITDSSEFKADILIEDEVIKAIGSGFGEDDIDEITDAACKYVIPGGVDNHSHYDALNSDGVTSNAGYETSWCSALGGTTTCVEFAANDPGKSMADTVKYRINERTKGKVAVDYAIHALCTEVHDDSFTELSKLVEIGVPTLKLFMAYKPTSLYMDDSNIFRFLRSARECGMTVGFHAENADILNLLRDEEFRAGHKAPKYHIISRPPFVEEEAVSRAIALAKAANCPIYIAHVSTKGAIDSIFKSREVGQKVLGETCTHYLTLDESRLETDDYASACKYVCSPALRDIGTQNDLWKALGKGILDIVGSDHSGIPMEQKMWGKDDFRAIPNGCPGSGDRMIMLWSAGVVSGRISKERFVAITSTIPAKLCGIYPKKGTIQPGSDADIVILNPNYKGAITLEESPTGVEYNIYEGMEQNGRIETVFLRGRKIVKGHKYVGRFGEGMFIPGKSYGLAYTI